jgi:hypothetical protein
MYVIEFDAAQLVQGDIGFRLSFANPAAAMITSAIAILSGSRQRVDQSATVTT